MAETSEIPKCYADRNLKLSELGYRTYAEYLASDDWDAVRKRRLRKRPNCLLCEAPATQVHHMDYGFETLLGLKPFELVSLCRKCHRLIEFDGKRKRTLEEANRALVDEANKTQRGRDWSTVVKRGRKQYRTKCYHGMQVQCERCRANVAQHGKKYCRPCQAVSGD